MCAFSSAGLLDPKPALPVQVLDLFGAPLSWMFGPGSPLLSLVLLVGASGRSAGAHEGVGQPPVQCCEPVIDVHTPYSSQGLLTLVFKKTRIVLKNFSDIGSEA